MGRPSIAGLLSKGDRYPSRYLFSCIEGAVWLHGEFTDVVLIHGEMERKGIGRKATRGVVEDAAHLIHDVLAAANFNRDRVLPHGNEHGTGLT